MATATANVSVGTDDGAYTATGLNTTRTTESWGNGSQFWRFQYLAVPQPTRCVIVSATLSLTPSVSTTRLSNTVITAQPGASAAISSGADATARDRTDASVVFSWNAGSSGAKLATITAVAREALSVASWTPGSALTLFAVRTSESGGGLFSSSWSHYTRDHTSAAATAKPILTVVYQPAGSFTGTITHTHSIDAGKFVDEGAAPGAFGVTGAAAGRKTGAGNRTGTATLTGTAAGRGTRQGATQRTLTVTGARTWRTARAGRLTGLISLARNLLVRPGRRGQTAGSLVLTGGAAGRPGYRGISRASTGLIFHAQGSTVRAGGLPRGTTALAGARRGLPDKDGQVLPGAVNLTGWGTVAGTARRGAVAGGVSGAGGVRGRPGGSGRTEGETLLSGAATGTRRHRGALTGTLSTTGQATATTGRQVELAFLVPLRPSWYYAATTSRGGEFHVTTQLYIRGYLADADHRAGMVEGHLVVGGATDEAVTGRKGHLSDPAYDVFVLGGNRRGRAARGGRSTRTLPAPQLTDLIGEPARGGNTHGTALGGAVTDTGLTGRSGEAHGRASLPGPGAGTLTGQAGRRGVSVSTTGTPSGLAAGDVHRRGGYEWFTRLYTRAVHISRAGRFASINGTVAAAPGTVTASAARAGTSQGSIPRAGGRLVNLTHRSGFTTGRSSIAGQTTSTRSDAAVVAAGALAVGGAARGVRAAGGQVSGGLRSVGNLAAATTRRSGCAGTFAGSGRADGGRGGQGVIHGGASINGAVATPVDFSGGTHGAATLHGAFTYTTRPPADVPHTILRTAYSHSTVTTTAPVHPVTVRTVTRKRGTVIRG